jgi:GNAT superfamily N-acetyltransferase
VRKLSDDDLDKPMIRSGERFIDKFSWSDHMYDGRVDPSRRTYVYERKGRIQGFVSFKLMARGSGLLIDEVAVDRRCQGSGIGGMLMRWAETCGRNEHCLNVQLWSAEDRKGWYGKMGYQLAGKEMTLDGVKFLLMTKKMLYNLPDDDVLTMGA